jgi:nucleotide-binding universal stress UspA family protein
MTVLVGVDGSTASLHALDLAVREASLRDTAVRLVYADAWAKHPAWVDTPRPGPPPGAEAALRAAREHSSAEFTTDVVAGEPGGALVRESAGAELVVVGHRGHGGFPELLLGSVAVKVAAHATGPVLLTRGPARFDGGVGVGVDGSAVTDAALGFAFAEAALRGVGLVAVHASMGPYLSGPTDVLIFDPDAERADQHRLLTAALTPWRERHPGVPVREEVRWDRPSRALVELSERVSLVAVGRRGRSGLPGRRLGSVTHALVHHASCPVAVVPT